MKAMIFAAGRGVRLKPITDNIPKALVKAGNKTLLEHVINKLKSAGVTDFVINVHYLAHQIKNYIKYNNNFGVNITVSHEKDILLETGGGLLNVSHFFGKNEDFFIHNVDILSDIDLHAMWDYHQAHKSLATLAVMARKTSRYFLFDEDLQLKGWQNITSGEQIKPDDYHGTLTPLAFSGIHVVNSQIFEHMTESGVFSMTPVYTRLSKEQKIMGYRHDHTQWFDIGKVESLRAAEAYFRL